LLAFLRGCGSRLPQKPVPNTSADRLLPLGLAFLKQIGHHQGVEQSGQSFGRKCERIGEFGSTARASAEMGENLKLHARSLASAGATPTSSRVIVAGLAAGADDSTDVPVMDGCRSLQEPVQSCSVV